MARLEATDSLAVLGNAEVERKDSGQSHKMIPSHSAATRKFSTVTAAGAQISSGTTQQVEILRDERNSDRYLLIKWNAGPDLGADYSIHEAQPAAFPDIGSAWLKIMTLPTRVIACGQAGQLHD